MPRGIISEMKQTMNLRLAVLCALILTFVWRFHDIHPVITAFKLAALATLAALVILVASPRVGTIRKALRPGYPRLYILVIVWAGISVITALSVQRAWISWSDDQIRTLLMFVFILSCAGSMSMVRFAMFAHILGATVVTYFYAKSGFPTWGSPLEMYDVNDMAMHFNMTLPFAFYFLTVTKNKLEKYGLWVLIVLMGASILMTQSRGGFLALGIGTLYVVIRSKGTGIWIRLLLPVVLVVGYQALPEETKERLSTLFDLTDDYNFDSETGRIEIWKRAVGYMNARPITGVGLDNFTVAEVTISERARDLGGVDGGVRGMVTHNIYLQVGSELGYPGLIMYVLALVLAIFRTNRLRSRMLRLRSNSEARDVAICAELTTLSLLAFCINGIFLSQAYAPIMVSVLGIAAGLEIVGQKILAAEKQAKRNRALQFNQQAVVLNPQPAP